MKFRLFLLFLLFVLTFGCCYGQSAVAFTVGALECGAVRRAQDQVQPYCYGPQRPLVVVANALLTIVIPGTFFSYRYGVDSIVWRFALLGNDIEYDLQINGELRPSGFLKSIFGALAIVGTLRLDGSCGPLQSTETKSPPAVVASVTPDCETLPQGPNCVLLDATGKPIQKFRWEIFLHADCVHH
jgi:hypothetical protein